jgi:hypothetical protein
VLIPATPASADDPQEENINLAAVIHFASMPPPAGSGGLDGGAPTIEMSSFQSGGSTPTANVIDNGQITFPPPPVLADQQPGVDNGTNEGEGLSYAVSPNPQVAVGPSHAVGFAEWLGRVYDKSTLAPIETKGLADLFNVPTPRCTDGSLQPCWAEGQPRLIYDDLSDRFIATYSSRIDYPTGLDEARLHIAISQTIDPLGYWDIYYHPYTNHYADEPWLGVTSDKITVSSNLFDIDTSSFVGQQTRVYNKAQMLAGDSVTVTVYPTTTSLFAVRPAQHMTTGNDQIAAMIQGNNLKVLRYTGPGMPTVSNIPIAGHQAPWDVLDEAGSIDTGDGRLLDAFVDGASLWVTANTHCQMPAASVCVQIFEVDLGSLTLRQSITDGSLTVPTSEQIHFLYPSARTDIAGNLVVVHNAVSGHLPLQVRMLGRSANDPLDTVSGSYPVHLGEVPVGSFQPAPWGAYFGAARDPDHPCVWVVGQYAKDIHGVSGGNDWGTVIARLAHPSVADQCADYDDDGMWNPDDTEDDGDGYTDAVEAGTPLCGDSRNEDNTDDGVVDDGCPGGPAQVGAHSEAQFKIGTGPLARCHAGGATNPSPSWPSDFASGGIPNSTDKVTLTDVSSFTSLPRKFGTKPGDAAFNPRWDVVPGRGMFTPWINLNDLMALTTAAGSAYPPMFGGARAFNGPLCSDP